MKEKTLGGHRHQMGAIRQTELQKSKRQAKASSTVNSATTKRILAGGPRKKQKLATKTRKRRVEGKGDAGKVIKGVKNQLRYKIAEGNPKKGE